MATYIPQYRCTVIHSIIFLSEHSGFQFFVISNNATINNLVLGKGHVSISFLSFAP